MAVKLKVKWNGKAIEKLASRTMKERVKYATKHLRAAVRANISVSVKKTTGPRGGIRKERSKPGEYPRRDTGALKKDIFGEVYQTSKGVWDGFVGSTLDYAFYLEMENILDRSFLRRSLREELSTIKDILTEP